MFVNAAEAAAADTGGSVTQESVGLERCLVRAHVLDVARAAVAQPG
jgi:hypothetical protein